MADLEQTRQRTKLILATEILRTNGRVQFMARGYSMLPSLWPGDVLTVQHVPFAKATQGQIVLYQRDEQFYAHRLRWRRDDCGAITVITRGDAMPQDDEPVSQAEWLGVVTSVSRAGKELREVPQCGAAKRALGWMLASSSRLRSVALRWKQDTKSSSAATLTESLPGSF